jgi:hypothetical protein
MPPKKKPTPKSDAAEAAARKQSEHRKRKRAEREQWEREQADREAYSIDSFCRAHDISVSAYYKLQRLGKGPREYRVLPKKPLITKEDALEWRQRSREEETTTVS